MTRPSYWPEATDYLSRRDTVMADLIRRYPETLERRGDSFQTLARAIVGQQISIIAADSVWERLEQVAGEVTPDSLMVLPPDQLQSAGLSRSKVNYLRNIAKVYLERAITDEYWQNQPFEQTRKELLAIKGIGPWTVEMFAIFHLHEPDIFSPADIGVQKAIARLYFEGEPVGKTELEAFSHRWCPYRTVALWYLWRHLDPVPVIY
ncbi:MAG: hypothetical protein AXA67_10335 [Methylothermaceae bacteria B42]|nr:MAG: hypothetical protein AXA67_10335 [Methylothermaceae bacteria B42]HHJ40534.1 DNA-3-methyladenine glycosylase 2 family protein [Methylothermaceae bacterium]